MFHRDTNQTQSFVNNSIPATMSAHVIILCGGTSSDSNTASDKFLLHSYIRTGQDGPYHYLQNQNNSTPFGDVHTSIYIQEGSDIHKDVQELLIRNLRPSST